MENKNFIDLLTLLEKEKKNWNAPVSSFTSLVHYQKDPYRILIATLLSLRTKDEITIQATQKLFSFIKTPQEMLDYSIAQIEKWIYPVGFYRKKAQNIWQISKQILEKYDGKVPNNPEELLKIKGIGRKTASLVLSVAYGYPAICVDTHVHRISNRLGIVETKNPHQTEKELMQKIPQEYWQKINETFVAFGQTICKPISPRCSICPVFNLCERKNITKYR